MKADQFGTFTQQQMYKMGYLTSKERQDKRIYGNKCSNCALMAQSLTKSLSTSHRCTMAGFATTPNATCNLHSQK